MRSLAVFWILAGSFIVAVAILVAAIASSRSELSVEAAPLVEPTPPPARVTVPQWDQVCPSEPPSVPAATDPHFGPPDGMDVREFVTNELDEFGRVGRSMGGLRSARGAVLGCFQRQQQWRATRLSNYLSRARGEAFEAGDSELADWIWSNGLPAADEAFFCVDGEEHAAALVHCDRMMVLLEHGR